MMQPEDLILSEEELMENNFPGFERLPESFGMEDGFVRFAAPRRGAFAAQRRRLAAQGLAAFAAPRRVAKSPVRMLAVDCEMVKVRVVRKVSHAFCFNKP